MSCWCFVSFSYSASVQVSIPTTAVRAFSLILMEGIIKLSGTDWVSTIYLGNMEPGQATGKLCCGDQNYSTLVLSDRMVETSIYTSTRRKMCGRRPSISSEPLCSADWRTPTPTTAWTLTTTGPGSMGQICYSRRR